MAPDFFLSPLDLHPGRCLPIFSRARGAAPLGGLRRGTWLAPRSKTLPREAGWSLLSQCPRLCLLIGPLLCGPSCPPLLPGYGHTCPASLAGLPGVGPGPEPAPLPDGGGPFLEGSGALPTGSPGVPLTLSSFLGGMSPESQWPSGLWQDRPLGRDRQTHGEWRQGEGRAENGVTMSSPRRAGAAWRGPSK